MHNILRKSTVADTVFCLSPYEHCTLGISPTAFSAPLGHLSHGERQVVCTLFNLRLQERRGLYVKDNIASKILAHTKTDLNNDLCQRGKE